MRKFYLMLFFTFTVLLLKAQNMNNIEQTIADIFEQYTAETDATLDYESFYSDLMNLATSPLNLNKATKDDMEKLQFLSETQIENIMYYVYKNKGIKSIYELQLIDGIDMTDIRNMLPFVYVGKRDEKPEKLYFHDIVRYGRHQLLFRLDRGLENKAGYKATDNNIAAYSGSPFYNYLKYHFTYKDRISAGVTIEKDPGEHLGDFISFHTQINRLGKLKTLVLGDYRAGFGLGLVMGSGFSTGKSSYIMNTLPHNSGIRKYTSSNEFNYFRGIASTIQLKNSELSLFYSLKNIDADTLNYTFQSIYTTGLHRTASEIAKKGTVLQQTAGMNINRTFYNLQTGFTIVRTWFNAKLEPDLNSYNYFKFRGKEQTTAGLNYRFRLSKFNFLGETAISNQFAFATLNGFTVSPVSLFNFIMLMRYYSPQYNALYASSFSAGSSVNNESGLYIGAEIYPAAKMKISCYVDSYRFPWPKYGVDYPSNGEDYLVQINYDARRDLSMFLRLKYKNYLKNKSGTNTILAQMIDNKKSSARYQLTYSAGKFSFKNIVECNYFQSGLANANCGYMALQDVSYRLHKIPAQIDFRYQFFSAENYENRFYTYENDLLYAFSIPVLYGVGSRYYVNFKYKVNRMYSIWLKFAQTVYSDYRDQIGSGNEMIPGNRKTDVRLLVQIKL